jgi:hypothetical protein
MIFTGCPSSEALRTREPTVRCCWPDVLPYYRSVFLIAYQWLHPCRGKASRDRQPFTICTGQMVALSGNREHELTVLLPHLAFHEPIAVRAGEKS